MGRSAETSGRYRRGKTESNDIDIVFTHPDPGQEKGALGTLVKRMNRRGPCTPIWLIFLTDGPPRSHYSHTPYVFISTPQLNRLRHSKATTSFSTHEGLRAFGHDESFDRLMTVFALPPDHRPYPYNPQGPKRTRRRVDLLFPPPEAYWTTIVGW